MANDTEILNWLIDNGGFKDDPNDEINVYARESGISLQQAVREVISEEIEGGDSGDGEIPDNQLELF